jgi:hypothetical protein
MAVCGNRHKTRTYRERRQHVRDGETRAAYDTPSAAERDAAARRAHTR